MDIPSVVRYFILACLLAVQASTGYASVPLGLVDGVQQLGLHAELTQGSNPVLGPASFSDADFEPVGDEFVTFRHAPGSLWLRFSIRNGLGMDEKRILSFDYPHVRNLTLYGETSSGWQEVARYAAEMSWRDKPLLNRRPSLLFNLPRNRETTYYLHLELHGKANQALEYEVRLYPVAEFVAQQFSASTPLLIFIGFMLSLLIYNLILYTRVGIRGYLYYSLYLVAQIIGLMAYEGFFYLLPQPPSIEAVVLLMTVSPILCGLFLIQFGRDILELEQNMPRANRALLIVTILLSAMMLLAAAGASWINLPMEVLGLLTIVTIAVLAIAIYRRGSKAALYFAVSFAFLFIGYSAELLLFSVPTMSAEGSVLSVTVLQWMERYFYYSCAAIEMLFLALALAAYIVQIRDDKDRAQQESIQNLRERQRIQTQYAIQLERDIEARTAEISRQSDQLREQAEQLRAMDELKSRFFANLSHEFRTPLTLIQGPIRSLLSDENGSLPGPVEQDLAIAARNTERLSQLIDELLMLAELESGSLGLQSIEQDLGGFCRRTASLFTHTAAEWQIAFDVQTPQEELPAYFDASKLEKVLCNLLSNAFKYTANGGKVTLSVEPQDEEPGKSTGDFARIEVCDNGVGIAEQEQAQVFDRFYRSERVDHNVVEGSGIGLALVKELVELHGGEIHLSSSMADSADTGDSGSCFTVTLPLGHDHLDASEMRVDVLHQTGELGVDSQAVQEAPADHAQPTVLVVEDNSDMRQFVVSRLEASYRVLQVANGLQALDLLASESVDLMVSDVMMPGLDGIGLLEKLRANSDTQHLPVVLLTARSSDEHRLQALRAHADDFLAKPFQEEELRLKIANLLRHREPVMTTPASGQPRHVTEPLDSADNLFLDKAQAVVQEFMGDAGFDVAALANALHMSRSTLQRRLEKAAGQTPAEFIRQLRLQQAHNYLQSKHFRTLAETAFAVGFNQPGYFSRLYRKYIASLETAAD